MAGSKLDPVKIAQLVFDEATNSYKTNIVDTEIAIELSADDGDSVIPQKLTQAVVVTANEVIDTSKVSRICLTVTSEILMVVGVTEVSLGSKTAGAVVDICTPELKIVVAQTVVLQS